MVGPPLTVLQQGGADMGADQPTPQKTGKGNLASAHTLAWNSTTQLILAWASGRTTGSAGNDGTPATHSWGSNRHSVRETLFAEVTLPACPSSALLNLVHTGNISAWCA